MIQGTREGYRGQGMIQGTREGYREQGNDIRTMERIQGTREIKE